MPAVPCCAVQNAPRVARYDGHQTGPIDLFRQAVALAHSTKLRALAFPRGKASGMERILVTRLSSLETDIKFDLSASYECAAQYAGCPASRTVQCCAIRLTCGKHSAVDRFFRYCAEDWFISHCY